MTIIETSSNQFFAVLEGGTAAAYEAVPVKRQGKLYVMKPGAEPRLIRRAGTRVVVS